MSTPSAPAASLRRHLALLVALGLGAPPAAGAQQAANAAPARAASYDTTAFAALRWRELGPPRGGRSVAVAGSAQRPLEYWMGTTGGGVWKTTDGGMNWQPMSDRYFGGTIGAIAVDPQNPDVVYVGGGETQIRGNTAPGDGLWKTTDGGRTWAKLGFDQEYISTIRVHPTNSQVVYLGVFGRVFAAGPERGVYKSTDGGRSFRRVLFVNDSTGAIDLALDPSNPEVLYAALWQAYRTPWSLSSGGPHSAIYKTTDGGANWTNLTQTARGLPTGLVGKIGLAVSPAKPSRVWALIEHDSGGVYRSDDGGQTWAYLNRERKLRQRAWYYTKIVADPRDTNMLYALNVGFFRSRDGGRTFPETLNPPHGDNHALWIAPNDPTRMIEGNDGGANVSFNRGASWTDQDFPTAQFYHVTTTNDWPYHVCGAQQDNSTLCGPSRKEGGVRMEDWYDAGGGESGYIAPNPRNPDIIFAGSYGGLLTRKDRRTGFERNVTVYPNNPMGWSSEDIPVRFQWTFPIVFSRHTPNLVYAGGNFLYRSSNEGQSWTRVSPDLSRHDPRTMGPSGGPITKDQTGVETYGTIFTFDESPVQAGLLWAGTDDGYVWVSRTNGGTGPNAWTNVTPKDIGDFSRISIVEPSPHLACGAYVAANRYQQDDKRPLLYKTTDCGRTWTKIVNGIPEQEFTRVIRADPVRRGLLFAGTERGVWVSFDDGANWQSLKRNLPPVPVHDLAIKEGDLIAGTHGRSFWLIDDISALRQLSPTTVAQNHLYKPRDAYRTDFGGGGFGRAGGAQAPSGVVVYYNLARANQRVDLEFLDAAGKVIRTFTSEQDSLTAADSVAAEQRRNQRADSLVGTGISRDSALKLVRAAASGGGPGGVDFEALARSGPRPQRVPNRQGLNAFQWNLRYPDAVRFENLIMWAANTTGPVAPPGTYSVRMKVDGATQTQAFVVKKDPRSGATLADLQEQFRFLTRIRDTVSAAHNAVRTVRNVRWQVADRRAEIAGKPQAGEFAQTADQLMSRLTKAEEEIYQVRNQSNQDPLNYPIRINNKIAALMGVVASTEAKPTAQSYEVYNQLTAELETQLKAVRSAIDELVPRLNQTLRAAGLQPIVPSTQETKPGARPAVTMD